MIPPPRPGGGPPRPCAGAPPLPCGGGACAAIDNVIVVRPTAMTTIAPRPRVRYDIRPSFTTRADPFSLSLVRSKVIDDRAGQRQPIHPLPLFCNGFPIAAHP